MPRPSKGPRLFKRRARYRGKKLVAQAVWIIKDDGKHIATGSLARSTETKPPREAEQALSDYIAKKYQPARRRRDIEEIDCADVLLIAECFVELNGKPVASVKKGFKRAVRHASLTGTVTPHTLRHTATTWLMQRGVPVWEATGFLGMSAEVLLSTCGLHHPGFLHGAANAITSKHRVSVVESVVELESTRERRQKAR